MMNKNTRVIYKKLQEEFKDKGYINLNERDVNTDNDLIEISSLFRDLRYETMRIFYIRKNKIAGYESLTSKLPNKVLLNNNQKRKVSKAEYYMNLENRMKRLKADSYFLVHNHPSGNPKFSGDDIRTTIDFMHELKGFKGHIIIGDSSYSMYSLRKNHTTKIENNIEFDSKRIEKMNNKLKKKSIYDIKVSSRSDFISLVSIVEKSKDFSTAILTTGTGEVRMILDIPNRMINMKKEQLKGYFKNLAKMNGVTRVLFATNDNDVYKKGLEHFEYGTFKDLICYKDKEDDDKMYVYQQSNDIDSRDLFDDRKIIVADKEDDYVYTLKDNPYIVSGNDKEFFKNIPKELPKADLNHLRILHKKVGYPPEVKVIEDTLEAKQKIVDGLIEIVPFKDSLIVCNEEGKLINLAPNLLFDYDYIAGDVFLVGDDYENSDFKSLDKKEINRLTKELSSISLRYLKNVDDEREIDDGR